MPSSPRSSEGARTHGFEPPHPSTRPGLIWGQDFTPAGATPVDDCDMPRAGGFRWLHLNLADQRTQRWIAQLDVLPEAVRELLLSPDTHQRALVDGGVVGCVLHDFERDFHLAEASRVGALRMALTPNLMITTRHHPLRSADIVKQKLARASGAVTPAMALDLMISAITEVVGGVSRLLSAEVQEAEDAFLEGHTPPGRDLVNDRRRLAQLHRMLDGMRAVFYRLERDEELPDPLLATVEKLSQRLQALDADIVGVQGQLRLLREELDLQAAQRTNQNLYILSIMTALLMPATLVTGVFGMNTGGLLWTGTPLGSIGATVLAIGASAATYFLLRWLGFMRR